MAKSPARAEMSNPAWEGTVDRMNFPPSSDLHLPADVSHDMGGRTIIDNRSTAADPIELLPEKAQQKLRNIRQDWQDVGALIAKDGEDWNEKHANKIEAERNYLVLIDRDVASRHSRSMTYGLDHPLAVEAKQKVDAAKLEFARVTERRDARSFRRQPIGLTLNSIDKYLRDFRNVRLVEHEPVIVELKKNEAVSTAIERIRKDIAKLGADLHAVHSAPYRSVDIKARAKAEIRSFAQRGAPDVFEAIETNGPIKWPESIIRSEPILHALGPDNVMHVGGIIDTTMHSARDFVCWLFEDSIVAKLDAEINLRADDGAALSAIDRQTKLTSIADEILDCARQEERLIELSVEQGLPIPRRPECDPRAVLGIDGPSPKADY